MKLKFWRCVETIVNIKSIKLYLYKYLTDFHLLNKNLPFLFQNVVSLYFSQCKKKNKCTESSYDPVLKMY